MSDTIGETTNQTSYINDVSFNWGEQVVDFAQYSTGILVLLSAVLIFYSLYRMLTLTVTHKKAKVPIPKGKILQEAKKLFYLSIALSVIEPIIYSIFFGSTIYHYLQVEIASIIAVLSHLGTFLGLLYVLMKKEQKGTHPFTFWHTLLIYGILLLGAVLSISSMHAMTY